MDLAAFKTTLTADKPPQDMGPRGLELALTALWWDAKGDWDAAHQQVQQDEGNPICDWVHAYLHRKEGDASNARYWYRSAGKPAASGDLDREWGEITQALLQAKGKAA
jgi:hypothetical protein